MVSLIFCFIHEDIFRNSKEKENSGLVQQLPKNEVKADQVEIMDISQAVEDVQMQETEIEDIDADDAGNPQLVVEYVNDIYGYLRYVLNIFSSALYVYCPPQPLGDRAVCER